MRGTATTAVLFVANELLAFSQCFDLPLGWWFIPPPQWAGPTLRTHHRTPPRRRGWQRQRVGGTGQSTSRANHRAELTGLPAPWATALTTVDSARRAELQHSLLISLAPDLDRQIHELATRVAQLEATTPAAALRAAPRPTGD